MNKIDQKLHFLSHIPPKIVILRYVLEKATQKFFFFFL